MANNLTCLNAKVRRGVSKPHTALRLHGARNPPLGAGFLMSTLAKLRRFGAGGAPTAVGWEAGGFARPIDSAPRCALRIGFVARVGRAQPEGSTP